MTRLLLLAIVLLSLSCNTPPPKPSFSPEYFFEQLEKLKDKFQIPGLAAAVVEDGKIIGQRYFGYADLDPQIPVDSTTLFPIASITKVYSAVLLLKLVEQGRLSLDDPISPYFTDIKLPDSLKIGHILSHTSQGAVGQHFYYSPRFSVLTRIIEQASGQAFSTLMDKEIFEPLALRNSLLLQDSAQLGDRLARLARPYEMTEEGIREGPVEWGYSASAGIAATLSDLVAFSNALDGQVLLSRRTKEILFSPPKADLPYGHGIFSQDFAGERLLWAYGQYDGYSSLLLKLPAKDLSLVLLANNNLMSDPARLIYGDVYYSLFALAFLDTYSQALFPVPQGDVIAITIEQAKTISLLSRQKLLAEALADSFLARFDTTKLRSSERLLQEAFAKNPDLMDHAGLSLLHNFSFLKTVAFHSEMGDFNTFDVQLEMLGNQLLDEDPDNPYAHFYLGEYHAGKGNTEVARTHFEHIVNAPNFSKQWYTKEAEEWLQQNK
ncbi:MAG: serine hydrolase domain-containing protein [Bacteroidota bacterium]